MARGIPYHEVWIGQETNGGGGKIWMWMREQTLEEELLTLQVLASPNIQDLHSIFMEAVTDSLANILGENEAKALMILIRGTDLTPYEVFSTLDSMLHEGSYVLKDAITEEFRANVHLLLEKVKRNVAEETESLRAKAGGVSHDSEYLPLIADSPRAKGR